MSAFCIHAYAEKVFYAMKKFAPTLLVLMLVSPYLPLNAKPKPVEMVLIEALQFDHQKQARVGDSGKAIIAYLKAGYLSKKPNARADYIDFYVLKKPAVLMGHTLVMIEHEYMSEYIGCCASPGIGLLIKTSGNTANLEKFSKENACTFSNHVDAIEQLKNYAIKAKLTQGNYASVSCRERDVPEK
jgi:uncharacterized protein YfcZ (UPF0381/DUF406 family)